MRSEPPAAMPWRLSRNQPRPRPWWRCLLRIERSGTDEAPIWAVSLSCVARIRWERAADLPSVGDLVDELLRDHARDCGLPIARACAVCHRKRSPGNLVAERPDRAVCREWTPCEATAARNRRAAMVYRDGFDGPQPRRAGEGW